MDIEDKSEGKRYYTFVMYTQINLRDVTADESNVPDSCNDWYRRII